jgi:RNA polymerase sigma-70 factor (ECF subfamily)
VGKELDWSILMARAQAGDASAYSRLLGEMTPFLRALASRQVRNPADAEDAVQDILVTVHRIRVTYDPTRPFGPWLVAIARRRLVDYHRRQGRQRRRETPLADEHSEVADPNAALEGRGDSRHLQSALSRLPAGQQQAVRLLKLDELTLAEASAVSGLSISALKVAVHRALKSLRAVMSKGSEP